MIRTAATWVLALPLAASAADPVIFDNGDSASTGGRSMSNDFLVVDSSGIGSSVYLVTGASFAGSEVGTEDWDGRIRWFLFADDRSFRSRASCSRVGRE